MMELVYRSLAGELDEADNIALNAWLDEAEERRNWYLALQQTDLLSAVLREQAPVRVDRLLRDTYEHIQQATGISSSFRINRCNRPSHTVPELLCKMVAGCSDHFDIRGWRLSL